MKRNQLEAVELAIRLMLQGNPPSDPAEKLIYDIIYKFYSRIRTRIERITPTKDGWSIKFTEQEANAMHVFVSNFPVPEGYTYEQIQIETIYHQLDQEYGRPICRNQEYSMLAT